MLSLYDYLPSGNAYKARCSWRRTSSDVVRYRSRCASSSIITNPTLRSRATGSSISGSATAATGRSPRGRKEFTMRYRRRRGEAVRIHEAPI